MMDALLSDTKSMLSFPILQLSIAILELMGALYVFAVFYNAEFSFEAGHGWIRMLRPSRAVSNL